MSGYVSSSTNPRSTDNVHADSATLIPFDLGKQVKKITQHNEMLLLFMFKQNDTWYTHYNAMQIQKKKKKKKKKKKAMFWFTI